MPRLHPRLFHLARRQHPFLPLLLYPTRDLRAAQNELQWLKDYAIEHCRTTKISSGWRHTLRRLCTDRSRGKPLQYLLGSEFFGDLEILCEPGVLIPRQETAASVTQLVHRLGDRLPRGLGVLDLCTGTGCIPLLVQNEFSKWTSLRNTKVECLGVDISTKAISLAKKNLMKCSDDGHLSSSDGEVVKFVQADVLSKKYHPDQVMDLEEALKQFKDRQDHPSKWNILISNPPYISPTAFNNTTARSVRHYEPKLALVPDQNIARYRLAESQGTFLRSESDEQGDLFYPCLLEIADDLETEIVLFEVSDLDQARRVARIMLEKSAWDCIEIWRDQPTSRGDAGHALEDDSELGCLGIKVRGHGNGRSVFAWRGAAVREHWVRDI